MANIISIKDKLELSKEKKETLLKKQKISAIRKVLRCTHCSIKCEKCGTKLEPGYDNNNQDQLADKKIRVPYRFCESCQDEYIEYIEHLKGFHKPDHYWQNEDWFDVWRKWIDYQSSVDRYTKSKEFIALLREFKQFSTDT